MHDRLFSPSCIPPNLLCPSLCWFSEGVHACGSHACTKSSSLCHFPAHTHIHTHTLTCHSSMIETSSFRYNMQHPSLDSINPAAHDLLAQLFWTSAGLLESDYEGEYTMALRLMSKVNNASKFHYRGWKANGVPCEHDLLSKFSYLLHLTGGIVLLI